MSIGNRIANARKEKGYTQEYVAQMMNVSRQAVSKWEKGICCPDTNNLIALSELLNISVEYLATGKQVPSPAAEQSDQGRTARAFQFGALGCLFLAVVCWCVGLCSGIFTDMVTIPAGSGLRVGIPLLLYGDSPAAIGLLILEIIGFILMILLLIIAYYVDKK